MANDMVDEMDAMLLSLIEKEIPDGRKALVDSHKNLSVLSNYCKENYFNSQDKRKALEETKSYASQSLASVAYQIHSLAVNMLQLMDQQDIQLQHMMSNANNIGLQVDIHKEKVARREIGVLTSSKNFSRSHKIVVPAQQEKPKKYKRQDIDYSALDHIGHGVKTDRRDDQRCQSTSSSSGSLKAQSVSSIHSSSQGSLQAASHNAPSEAKRPVNTGPVPRPPVAPVAPTKIKAPVAPAPVAPVPPPPTAPPPPSFPVAPPPSSPPTESNMPPPPVFVPEPDYDGELDALLQSLDICLGDPSPNTSLDRISVTSLGSISRNSRRSSSTSRLFSRISNSRSSVDEKEIARKPPPAPPPPPILSSLPLIVVSNEVQETEERSNLTASSTEVVDFKEAVNPSDQHPPSNSSIPPPPSNSSIPPPPPPPAPGFLSGSNSSPVQKSVQSFPPPLNNFDDSSESITPEIPTEIPLTELNLPEPNLDSDDNETAQLPPPPPDLDELYQVPSSIAVVDDALPPPPPPNDSFYDQPPPPQPVEEKVVAIYDYQKLRDDELELTEGDVLYVIKKNDDGWYEGIKDGMQGLFPGNYVAPYT